MATKPPSKTCSSCGRVYITPQDFLANTSRWRQGSEGELFFNCSCRSTLVLPKGKYPWYSPDMAMGQEARSVFNKIGQSIPCLPSSVFEFEKKLRENADANELAACAKVDPLLAGRILNLANLRSKLGAARITSVSHAISSIGRAPLANLIVPAAISGLKSSCTIFTPYELWREAFLAGKICASLGERFSGHELSEDELFLLGNLCSGLGKLIQSVVYPNETDTVFARSCNTRKPTCWEAMEQEQNLPSRLVLGEIGAALWGLPEFLLPHLSRHMEPNAVSSWRQCEVMRNGLVGFSVNLATYLIRPQSLNRAVFSQFTAVLELTAIQLNAIVKAQTPHVATVEALMEGLFRKR